jgi:hypothetical protein
MRKIITLCAVCVLTIIAVTYPPNRAHSQSKMNAKPKLVRMSYKATNETDRRACRRDSLFAAYAKSERKLKNKIILNRINP